MDNEKKDNSAQPQSTVMHYGKKTYYSNIIVKKPVKKIEPNYWQENEGNEKI